MSVETAKKFVKCKHWRWLSGMRPMRRSGAIWELLPVVDRNEADNRKRDLSDCVPCLGDGATQGAILDLVRDAYGDPDACVGKFETDCWEVWTRHVQAARWVRQRVHGETMCEALLAALEAAP